MTRPRHGLSLLEALQRWSDPEAWAEIEALVEARGGPRTSQRIDPEVRATPVFTRVLTEFQRMLCDAELVASATHEYPDPRDPRFVVDPDVMRTVIIRLDLDRIVGPGVTLCSPEIFAPDAIPLNIRPIPEWLRELAGADGASPAATSPSASDPGGRRPMRGLSLEEALQRWSDPPGWEAMNALSDAARPVSVGVGQQPTPAALRHQKYRRQREPLEEELLRKLRYGELVASATDERPSPTDPRFVVAPETFDRVGFEWDWPDVMTGINVSIHNVEIFEPPGVPRNIRIIPDWYWKQIEPAQNAAQPSGTEAKRPPRESGFSQEADYRRVRINGVGFALTRLQAKVVKNLHQASLADDEWRSGKKVLEEAGSRSLSIYQIFRPHKAPHWRLLIESDGNGLYRLNIRE